MIKQLIISKSKRSGALLLKAIAILLFVQNIIGCKGVAQVDVDFSQAESPASMMGFLHGVEETSHIADAWLEPLFAAPVSWRIRPKTELVNQAIALGIEKPIIVVTDTWNGQAPARDWSAWEAHVRSIVQQFGNSVIYDIINEPDMPLFWQPQNGHPFPLGWADLHETFKRSHDVIRSELGNEAIISGPSFSFFWGSEKRLYDFVQYCHDNQLTIQILSVHTLYESDIMLPMVSNTLKRYRRDFIESGNYSGAGIEYLHVNEYGLPDDYTRPGTIVSTLYHFERGGVDAANRAHWSGRVENVANTIDGYLKFLDPDGASEPAIFADIMFSYDEPRPVWWVYRYYASGVASRVYSESNSRFVQAIASAESDTPEQAQIMIGASASKLSKTKQAIHLKLNHLEELPFACADQCIIEIKVKKIVNDETIPLVSLPTVISQRVAITLGQVDIQLPPLGDYEAYVVLISGV